MPQSKIQKNVSEKTITDSKLLKKQSQKKQDSKKYTNPFDAWGAFWNRGFTEWAGTSSRSEYWWTFLINFLIVICSVLFGLILLFGPGIYELLLIFYLMAFIPSLSLLNRRLHDIGLSSWYWLFCLLDLLPVIGKYLVGILIFIVAIWPTKVKGNPYHKYNK